MTSMQGYEIELSVPLDKAPGIPVALERYDTTSIETVLTDWFDSMSPEQDGDFVFMIDGEGVHISGSCGIGDQFYSETTRLRNMLGLALPGGWATVRYEDDGGGEYTIVTTEGGIVEHTPITVYPTLPHTITDDVARTLLVALSERPNRSQS